MRRSDLDGATVGGASGGGYTLNTDEIRQKQDVIKKALKEANDALAVLEEGAIRVQDGAKRAKAAMATLGRNLKF
jgi:L-asparaginase II